jgi:hypothetical protein
VSTDDLLRQWLRPTRPYVRLAMMFAPGLQPLVEDMIEGRTSVPRGLWIMFWFTVGALDALYQRSPRARPNALAASRIDVLTMSLPPPITPPNAPPSGDLPRPPEEG